MYDIYTCVCMVPVLSKARERKELYGITTNPWSRWWSNLTTLYKGESKPRLPGFPFSLRVYYTPASAEAPIFRDLHSFVLRAVNFGGEQEEEYRLCAVVQCRASNEYSDLVRLYAWDGQYVFPPGNGHDLIGDDWRLGEYGFSYLLFYCKAKKGRAPRNDERVTRLGVSLAAGLLLILLLCNDARSLYEKDTVQGCGI